MKCPTCNTYLEKAYSQEDNKVYSYCPQCHGCIEPETSKNNFKEKTNIILKSLSEFLVEKNIRYGNSALESIGIFSKHVSKENSEAQNGILVRMDDKLKRIKNSEELRKNDIVDLLGYLVILCNENNWSDFSEFID